MSEPIDSTDLSDSVHARGSSPVRLVIVGGGITGLAAAHRLCELTRGSDNFEIRLFEAGPELSGVLGTRDIAGYTIETGADSFITNKPWGMDLCRRLGMESELIPTQATYRRSLVLRRGRVLEVPEGFQLLAPVQLMPLLRSPLFTPWGKLRMGLEYLLPPRQGTADESLASFVTRRFGREALDRLVQPLVGGIYTSNPEQLSLHATLYRFRELEQKHGSVLRGLWSEARSGPPTDRAQGARYGLFVTPRRGISQLVDALARAVGGRVHVECGATVNQIDCAGRADCAKTSDDGRPFRSRTSYRLQLADGRAIEAEGLILAVPAFRAGELISGWRPELAQRLKAIEYASTAVVITGHRLSDVRHPLNAFGLVIPALERRGILAVSFTSRKFAGRAPDGAVQMRTFIGGAMQPELLQRTDAELVDLVRRELHDLLGVTWRPDLTHVARWTRAMPQYHVGHLERVAAIKALAEREPGFALAGNAYGGVGLPDCIHSGEVAAERVMTALRPLIT